MILKSFLALCLFGVNVLIAMDINTIGTYKNCSNFLPKAPFVWVYTPKTCNPIISSQDLTDKELERKEQSLQKTFDSCDLSKISVCGNIYKFPPNGGHSVLFWNRSNNMIITRHKLDTMLCEAYYIEKSAYIDIYPVISLETNQYIEFDFKDFYEKMELRGIKQVINIYSTANNIKNLSVIFNQNVESVSIITPAIVHTIWPK